MDVKSTFIEWAYQGGGIRDTITRFSDAEFVKQSLQGEEGAVWSETSTENLEQEDSDAMRNKSPSSFTWMF